MNKQKFPDWTSFTPESAAADLPRLLAEAEKGVAEIEALEREIAEILASDPLANRERFAAVPDLQAKLDAKVERWAELEERAGGKEVV